MSLINDALIKAERDRAEAAVADAAGLGPAARAARQRETKRVQSLKLIVFNALALTALFAVVIVVLLRNRSAPDELATTPLATTSGRAASTEPELPPLPTGAASEGSAAASPFLPAEPETAPSPIPPAAPPYELVGMTEVGSQVLLGIMHREDRRSVWVPVGKTVGAITAVSYDATTDRATIRAQGRQFTLSLHHGKPAGPADSPTATE